MSWRRRCSGISLQRFTYAFFLLPPSIGSESRMELLTSTLSFPRARLTEWNSSGPCSFKTDAKLNCYARDYEKSTCDQLPAEVLAVFRELATQLHLYRLNLGRSKAYISLSKKLGFEWSDSFERIVESYRTAYTELSEVGSRSISRLHGVEATPPSEPRWPAPGSEESPEERMEKRHRCDPPRVGHFA